MSQSLIRSASVLAVRTAAERADAERLLRDRFDARLHQGETLLASFESAEGAVDAARDLHSLLAEQARPTIAVAHGEIIERGGLAIGAPIDQAERLLAGSVSGEILVTDLVRRMVAPSRRFERILEGVDLPEEAAPAWRLVRSEPAAAPELPEWLRLIERSAEFVGRQPELGALRSVWQSACGGERRLALISGEPGIGKTRLAGRFAGALTADGALALYGGCDESLPLPYQPFVEPLTSCLGILADGLERPGDPELELVSRIVPSLAGAGRGPEPGIEENPDQQYRLFGAVASMLSRVSRSAPVLLVLEDLHWADRQTLLLLRHLMSAPQPLSALIVATYRDTDLDDEHPLRSEIPRLQRNPATVEFQLEGLDREQLLALAELREDRRLSGAEVKTVEAAHAESGGNPLLATELLGMLESGELLSSELAGDRPSEPLGVPPRIQSTVLERVERLGPDGVELMETAAVIGIRFDCELLGELLERPGEAVEQTVARACEWGLIQAGESGSYAFRHALFQRALYERLLPAKRRRIHQRIAERLEGRQGRAAAPAAMLARHWVEAGSLDPARAIECCDRAGREAVSSFDAPAAEAWFARALELYGTSEDARRCDLLIRLGAAQRGAGNAGSRGTLLDAARLAERIGEERLLIRAALANSRGFASASGTVDGERIAVLEAALRHAEEESVDRALLTSTLAAELTFSGDYERRAKLSDEALRIARLTGDRATLAQVLVQRFVTIWIPKTLPERIANAEEAVAIADELGDPQLQFHAVHWLSVGLLQAGRVDEAVRAIEREEELAGRLGDPTARWIATYDRGNLAVLFGQLDEAEDLATEAFEIGRESGQPDALSFFGSQISNIRFEQGRLGELQGLLAEVVSQNPGIPAFRAVLALAYGEAELRNEARNLLAIDATSEFEEIPPDVTWLAGHTIYAHVCADLGEERTARILFDRLAPIGTRIVYTGISVWGDLDHALGRLATVLRRFDEAERLLAGAAQRYREIGAPVWLARAELDTARLLLQRDAGDDRGRAVELLERAAESARRLGAAGILRRCERIGEHARAQQVIRSAAGPAAARLGSAGHAPAAPAGSGGNGLGGRLEREGEMWRLEHHGSVLRIRNSKGMQYLARLLTAPGVEHHALDLQAGPAGEGGASVAATAQEGLDARGGAGDAGPMLDEEAKRAYRSRIEELHDTIEEADRFNDTERAARAREELEYIGKELASAVGLSGRDRKAASGAERARVNVTRAIRKTIRKIAELDGGLGEHLERSVKTGTFCSYEPPGGDEPAWREISAG